MATYALSSSFPAPFPTGTSQEGRIRSLQMLNDAAQRINSILDLDQLLDQVVNDVNIRFGFVETGIMLLDEDRGELVLAGMRGCSKHHVGHRYRVGREGLVGHAAGTLESIYVADVTKDPRYIACEPDTRSEMAIPLVANGRLVGVFTASHPALDGFTPEQQELLLALAGHIAIAVENARRFQQEQHSKLRLDRRRVAHPFLRGCPTLPPREWCSVPLQ